MSNEILYFAKMAFVLMLIGGAFVVASKLFDSATDLFDSSK